MTLHDCHRVIVWGQLRVKRVFRSVLKPQHIFEYLSRDSHLQLPYFHMWYLQKGLSRGCEEIQIRVEQYLL